MKPHADTSELGDDELLAELGVTVEASQVGGRTPREERIVAGFEDIQRFVEVNGRAPRNGEELDIFERLYAVRLDCLRAMPEAHALLSGLDTQGLLHEPTAHVNPELETLDDETLLAELEGDASGGNSISELKHVRSSAERQAAEEVANHAVCKDFDRFKPLFAQAEKELQSGLRQTRPFGRDASVSEGSFFILGGQLVYVAEVGETIKRRRTAKAMRA